ncbi:MAG: hypothetical protein JW891_04920 [Candidatus Lokiarchaeota archaeon]|nr:hypothetical protein [Candidatus Lokiarchaeota archaeon]
MKQGIFFVNSNLDRHYQYPFHGLGRHPLSDPNNFTEYEAGLWWQNALANVPGRVLVPMDSRTTASPTGIGDYVFYRAGGWSWAIPYIAGAYALACQVDPAITPARFLEIAIETGVPLFYQGYNIGKIINPNHIIVSIQIP